MQSTDSIPAPTASILIPYHNCRKLTEDCLASLAEHSDGETYEVILVDDASTEQPDIGKCANRDLIRVLRNEIRKSYSENNNQAAAVARGEFLVLLNNDTILTPGWLRALVRSARRETQLGVLGNKHLFPETKLLHHCGMAFDATGHPVHLHPGNDPELPSSNMQREFQCVTFACVLIPAKLYCELGGLDAAYRNGFEDVDFCLRARGAGYRVAYTPGSTILHYGQSTPDRKANDDANWQLFQQRWGGKVALDLHATLIADAALNERQRSRPQRPQARREPGVHFALDFSEATAFTWAMSDLIMALARRDVPISLPASTLLHDSIEPEKQTVLRGLIQDRPRGTHHVKWTHYWPSHLKPSLSGEVNAEFFCTNYRYRAEGRWLDLWMRHVQVNGHKKLAVAGFNRDALREVGVPDEDISVVPLGYAPEIDKHFPLDAPLMPRDRRDFHLLHVTNSHDLYRYGTDLAVKALGQAFGPDDAVVVHIKDYGPPQGRDLLKEWIAAQPRFPRVEWHREFLSKPDLMKLYADADAQLAPFRGEGFAMKILDAMALGVPTLLPMFGGPTEFAAPGTIISLPFDEVLVEACYDRDNFYIGEGAYWCEARVAPMAEELRRLLSRRDELVHIGNAARAHVRSRYSWDAAAGKLMNALEGWGSTRRADVAIRRRADEVPLSVVMPTKDRVEILDKTLAAYAAQSFPAKDYELLLVNDHGARAPLDALVQKHAGLRIKLMDNDGPTGPAAARNFAIERARGEIVVITGDDIVPHPDFLKEHVAAHARHPEREIAFVGLTEWHPDIPHTPFMELITGKGGQQFSYTGMKHDEPVQIDRMYTSNCSLKRDFLIEETELFCTNYRYAAFEDVELACRLYLRGMELRYTQTAIGFHLHEMAPRSFLRRQRLVGRMLTLFAIQRPWFVPQEHTCFLRALEFLRSWPPAAEELPGASVQPEAMLEQLVLSCESMLNLGRALATTAERPLVDSDRHAWQQWMVDGLSPAWESTNELVLRLGMVEEWAQRDAGLAKALQWIQVVGLPRVVGHGPVSSKMPFSTPQASPSLFPHSRLAYEVSNFIRNVPILGAGVSAVERSAAGRYARRFLAGLVKTK